ncbi:helix-turn-helix transcriptional regulator [Agaribacterium haliotis]|uniref:helix-turn-helix domain-containing protein n=1 Tax=Agaribacterium haliotis TaxID=2013869 RepID=UPI0032E3E4F0
MVRMIKTISSARYQSLISWLKEARAARGYSMRDLSDILGESHSLVQKVECLERRLDVYEYVQYCKALDIDPEQGLKLLKFTEDSGA